MSEEDSEKLTLVPRLRFPEFQEAGAWGTQPLRNVAQLLDGDWIESKDQSAEGVRLIQTGNIGVGDFIPKDGNARFISEETFRRLKCTEVVPGDCLISRLPDPAGRSCLVPDMGSKMITAVDCTIVRFNLEEIVPYLFISFSQSDQYFSEVQAQASGSTRLRISRENLSNIDIPLAALPEQQKIADCLSSLDELITVETQTLDALKTHKKGLMQQLFPREGETVPRLRFPQFRESGEWEEKLIEDFFDVGSSKRVLQEDWTTQGVPFYRTRELVSLSKNEPFGSEIFISEALFCEIAERYGLPAEGDFLVSGVGTLGISYQVKAQDRFYFKDGNVLWFKLRGCIVSTFFKYCFEADEIQNQILAQASISTVGTYTIQNAKVTKFSCPTNIEEQQEIADCLSSLDDLITAQAKKIDALKTHKKGLMQQLFPVQDGVPA